MSAKVYCTVMGSAIRIGNFGTAVLEEVKNQETGAVEVVDQPVIVPDNVATELEEEIRGERPNPRAGEPGEPAVLKIGTGARTDIRVVRDVVAPLAAAPETPRVGRRTEKDKE